MPDCLSHLLGRCSADGRSSLQYSAREVQGGLEADELAGVVDVINAGLTQHYELDLGGCCWCAGSGTLLKRLLMSQAADKPTNRCVCAD